MDEWVTLGADEKHRKREREKAKALRKTPYFQELLRKGVCHYCKGTFPASELTLDHIVPVSRGGRSTRGNLVVCCRKCNQEKKYLTPAEQIINDLEKKSEN